MPKTRGSYQVSEARQKSILRHAFEVFSKNGFRGGSLKRIAELEGISEAGLLHHYKSKSELLIAVLEYRDVGTEYNFLPYEITTGEEFVHRWLDLISHNMKNKGIVELFCILSAESTAPDHPAHEYFKNRYQQVIQLVTEYFQIMQKSGQLVEGSDPSELANELIALSDGLQVQWLLNPKWDMIKPHKSFFKNISKPEFHSRIESYRPAQLMPRTR